MRISARQIELFQVAYNLRSARKAASALHISQPSISRAVAELEAEIGAALFDRSSRKFEPTAAAHSLYKSVQQHYRGLERVREAAQLIVEGSGGHLRLAALPAFAETLAAKAIGQLMARHPDLRIDLETLSEQGCLASIRAGKSDCAIISSDPGDANLTFQRLNNIQPVVIIPHSDPLSGQQSISPAQLSEKGLVMLPPLSPFRTAVEHMFDQAGVSFFIRAEARTQAALVELVSQGVGRAVVGKESLKFAPPGKVNALRLDAKLIWPVRVVASAADFDAPIIRNLIDELLEISV